MKGSYGYALRVVHPNYGLRIPLISDMWAESRLLKIQAISASFCMAHHTVRMLKLYGDSQKPLEAKDIWNFQILRITVVTERSG